MTGRIRDGWREITIRAYVDGSGRNVVIPEQEGFEIPCEGVEDDPFSHSCDHMGCGRFEHIIGRFTMPLPDPDEPVGGA